MRFTIKSLMLVVAFAAGLLALYVRFLAAYFPPWILAIPSTIAFVAYGLWCWRCRRVAAFGFVGSAILSNCLYAVASIYHDYMLMPALMFAWLLIFLPLVGASGIVWAKLTNDADGNPRRSPFWSRALVVVSTIMPGVTLATDWPLRLAFLASRPSLERVADQVATGRAIVSPEWIGPFRLAESAVDADWKTVGLFLDPNPGGRTGFVRIHADSPEAAHFRLLLGTDTHIDLGWGWSYRQDD
jgi:hypothetical protein